MDRTFETALARGVASMGHHGVTDKAGVPYIEHLRRVAAAVPDELKPAAWLHDLVEDTPATTDDLRAWGFAEDTIAVVDVVTRRLDESYDAFIARVASSPVPGALMVKLADVLDNLRPSCPVTLIPRYRKALAELGKTAVGESHHGETKTENSRRA